MITSEEYLERMRSLKQNCYMKGELLQRDDPRMLVFMGDIRMTFDLAKDPKYKDLILAKYFAWRADVDPEVVHRAFRMAQDLIAGPLTSNMQIAGVHGRGSPAMEDIAVQSQYDIEEKKNIARNLAGTPLNETKK